MTTLEIDTLGPIEVVSFRGDQLKVTVGKPKPPGTRVDLREAGAPKVLVSGKVTSVAAETPEPGSWELTLKVFAPSKATKALFAELSKSD